MPMPMVIIAANPATPNNELAKPNTEACSVFITEPQLRSGLKLQLGTNAGFMSSWIFSIVNINEAKNPITPPILNI